MSYILLAMLKLFSNYFSNIERVGKYWRAAVSRWNNFEIISGNFRRAEMRLFKTDVDERRNNFEIIIFRM